ncbi:platelet glycoprotein VI-like isoform X2 [Antechinus flavipes]|uniref:platelet glycoprotein VI-like isoform X2 n=1 Tax=Antechinus flavipes TaxID=38775 RepID=UPI0022367D98|nr:platelet glycoprotein VI-like isoform X2 [Antechinus flavipes]
MSPLSPEPGPTMFPSLVTLLVFGLWLSQRIRAQEGTLPSPTLQADPGPLIPLKKPVTLRCQGFPGADMYRLRKEGSSQYRDVATTRREAEFPIPSVVPNTTGSYYCLYKSQSHWSQPSQPLRLVMTDWYDKPSLSALPSPEVFLGNNVTLRCRSQQWFENYVLHKEGEAGYTQKEGKWYRADFHLSEVTAAQGGSYRCYSFHLDTIYEWSAPSDPLELRIRATDEPQLHVSSKPLSSANSTTNPAAQNYTVGNLIRLGLAGLVLIILGILLVEARCSQSGALRSGPEVAAQAAIPGQRAKQSLGPVNLQDL